MGLTPTNNHTLNHKIIYSPAKDNDQFYIQIDRLNGHCQESYEEEVVKNCTHKRAHSNTILAMDSSNECDIQSNKSNTKVDEQFSCF